MRHHFSIILALFIFFTSTLLAQENNFVKGGATSSSIGGITSLLKGLDAVYNNTASTSSFNKSYGIDISFENKYGISNLNNIGLAGIKKQGLSTFSFGAGQFGISEYTNRNFFLGYSRSLLQNFFIGSQVSYNSTRITDYGQSGFFSLSFSIYSKINKQLSIATIASNILKSKSEIGNSPSSIIIGFDYSPSDKASFFTEFLKIEDRPLSPKMGIAYKFLKQVEFRFGADIIKGEVGFGIGYIHNRYVLRLAYANHQSLDGSFSITSQANF